MRDSGMLLGPNYAIPGFQIDVSRKSSKHSMATTPERESSLISRTNEARYPRSRESFMKSYDLTATRQVGPDSRMLALSFSRPDNM